MSVNFSVGVDPDAEAGVYEPKYENESRVIHSFNISVENTASVGCRFSLKGRFEENGSEKTLFSKKYNIWPGQTRLMELNYIPENYTGAVESDIDLYFCGEKENITEYRFNVTEKTVFTSEIESETLEANYSNAKVSMNIKNATMYPIETPGFWKVSRAEIRNGTADLSYSAPLYKPDKIEYAVLGPKESVIGKTTVDTTPPDPTYLDKLRSNFWMILAGLLALSFAANLYLLREKLIPESVREKLTEIEFEGRDIRK